MSETGVQERLAPDVLLVPPAPVLKGPATGKPRLSVRSGGSSAGRRYAWLLGVLGAAVLSVWLYVLSVHANSAVVTSDGATVVLQGKAVASGNFLLHGWYLQLDSWWTLDVVFYAVATALVGVKLELLFAVPAVIAALVVVVGVVMARRGHRGTAALAGAATVLAVLALPTHVLAYYFISQPVHVSTALYALVAFMGLRQARFGWGWAVAVGLLAAGLLGDLQMASYGVLPALLAGLVAMGRRRSWRAGGPAVTAAACSVVLALVVRQVVDALGGFKIGAQSGASFHQMLTNVVHVPVELAQLVGILDTSQGTGGVPLVLEAVHIVAALLLLFCFVAAVARLIRGVRRGDVGQELSGTPTTGEPEPWRLDDLLVLGALGCIFNSVYLSHSSSGYLRYLTASVIFMAILAGREVTRWWAKPHRADIRHRAQAVAVVSTGCFLAACGLQVSVPVDNPSIAGLVAFLESHHLHSGVGDFWGASLTTVWSNGKVSVRPLVPDADGVLEAFNRGETPGWFLGKQFQFVVYPASTSANATYGVSLLTATETWGPPTRTYLVSGYEVLLWSHPIEVTHYAPLMQPV
jgi:hypothetical protein